MSSTGMMKLYDLTTCLSSFGVNSNQSGNILPTKNDIKQKYILCFFLDKLACYGFNSLWPSDTIWRQRSGSTLAQVMACCLTASSHYLNQCWLMISKVLWQPPEGYFKGYSIQKLIALVWKLLIKNQIKSPRPQWVKDNFVLYGNKRFPLKNWKWH